MSSKRFVSVFAIAAMLSGCGGSGSGGSVSTVSGATGSAPTPTPTATPTPVATNTAGCTLRARQDFVTASLKEWYLFPDTLPANPDPTPYATVDDYLNYLTATARAQGKDRYFTYLTTISGETAYDNAGASAGFGVRLAADTTGQRVFIIDSFEGAPALTAGIDRGAEIVGIGTSTADLRSTSDIIKAGGLAAVTDALGPDTAGTTRLLRITDAAGTRNVSVTKASYALAPVSTRFGAQVLTDNGRKVGYVNLRTFITPAEQPLRDAFKMFKAQGITQVIVDLRYNGGGLLSTAQVLANLLGGNRSTSDVIDYIAFRPEKASNNETDNFAPQPESISSMKIAFIGTGGTASASELVINAFTPYLHQNSALIGSNTYGKPVGQIALDLTPCDDRLRVIALAIQNAAHQGTYYNGLAGFVEASCKADDDIYHQMGSPQETLTAQALAYLDGKTCTPIAAGATTQSASGRRVLLTPTAPNAAQRDSPGVF